jgi:ABC-2 type transport system ATP-binding protein
MTAAKPIIQLKDASKRFGNLWAMTHVSADIDTGTIIGLVGDNGAGKSTLLRHIIGLYLPDRGTCTTFGRDVARLSRIGYVHQEGKLPDWMTAGQLIRYVSAYYPNWNHRLEQRYVWDFDIGLDDRVGTLSPGQRQKLAILLAIAFEPELLILDEPASALDPLARSRFLNLLLEIIQKDSRTIVISSHILSDIEKVIDHIMIMRKVRLIYDNSLDFLREEYSRVTLTSRDAVLPDALPFVDVLRAERTDRQARLTIRCADREMLKAAASDLNCDIEFHPLTLDQLYEIVITSV